MPPPWSVIVSPPPPLGWLFTRVNSVESFGSRILKVTLKAPTPGTSESLKTVETVVVLAPNRLTGETLTWVAPGVTVGALFPPVATSTTMSSMLNWAYMFLLLLFVLLAVTFS